MPKSSPDDIQPIINSLFANLPQATRTVSGFPKSGSEYNYFGTMPQHRDSFQNFGDRLKNHLDGFIQQGLGADYPVSNMDNLLDDTAMGDLTDFYLENVDLALRDLKEGGNTNQSSTPQKSSLNLSMGSPLKNLQNPYPWKAQIDNRSIPFRPVIQFKPNALEPLSVSIGEERRGIPDPEIENFPYPRRGMGLGGEVNENSAPHPYEKEIRELSFTIGQLTTCKPRKWRDLHSSPCTWVSTKTGLIDLANLLDKQTEFAIDLEHHSYRSFQGFSCLIQISTRDNDFIVDALELRDDLYLLNTSFTNPKIVKVMHGADCDILWLQRDFGIYVVNMFDTGQASRVMDFPSYRLSYLLQRYCEVSTDKKYQLADWRIRPLPSEMVKYAREDTHYLLYVYDSMRNDLFGQGGEKLMRRVLERSQLLCLRRYEKFILTPTSHLYLRDMFNSGIGKQEETVLQALYQWRDQLARKEDESLRFVLPDHMMVEIVRRNPQTEHDLLRCCTPVPYFIRQNPKDILKVMLSATQGLKPHMRMAPSMERKKDLSRAQSPIMSQEDLFTQKAAWVVRPEEVAPQSFSSSDDDVADFDFKSSNVQVQFSLHGGSQFMSKDEVIVNPNQQRVLQMQSFNYMDRPLNPNPYSQRQPDLFYKRKPVNTKRYKHHSDNDNDKTKHNYDKTLFETPLSTPPKPPQADHEIPTPPEERVPKSLNEIYKLAQQNRKKNKQKKRLKQTIVTDPRPAYSPDHTIIKKHDVDKPVDFMKRIGWIDKTPQKKAPEEEQSNNNKPHHRRGKQHRRGRHHHHRN